MFKTKIYIVASFLLLVIYSTIMLSLVWSRGVCCGDDAYHGIIAKNLANGLGYASTIQPFIHQYNLILFDPLVGTGPTIILPASIVIAFVGNTYWAPGLANVALWSILLFSIGYLLYKENRKSGFLLFTFSFLFLGYSLMTFHLEHWYALLGEVPVALLIILGTKVFYNRDTKQNYLLTGLLFSLAFEAKILSLVAFAIFLVAQLIIFIFEQSSRTFSGFTKLLLKFIYITLGFSIPIILFESWKLINLGSYNYLENWKNFLNYVGNDGARFDQATSIFALYDIRVSILFERFGLLLPNVVFMLLIGWILIRKDKSLRYLFITLVSIIMIYSVWWLFFSIGWARYFIINLIILIFVISLPLLSTRSRTTVFLYFMLIILFSSNTWSRLKYPFDGLTPFDFQPSAETQSLIFTSRLLSSSITKQERIATQWWGTAADIEYLMDGHLNFTTFHDDSLENTDVFFVAVNRDFMNDNDEDFIELIDDCKELRDVDSYFVATCPSEVQR